MEKYNGKEFGLMGIKKTFTCGNIKSYITNTQTYSNVNFRAPE